MNKSESIKSLSDALAKAQAELKNPHFDAVNPHFKSKFASLAAVREAVIPVFTKHGLSFTQWPTSNSTAAGCVNHLAHLSGEWMEETFLIPVDKLTAHAYVSAVTYAKRISMQSVAGVVGEEDDDGNAAVGDNVNGKQVQNGKGVVANPLTEMKEDAFALLPKEQQEFLKGLAADVTALTEEGREAEAHGLIEHNNLEIEEKLGLWHLLSSKARSAVKRAAEQARVVAKTEKKATHQPARA